MNKKKVTQLRAIEAILTTKSLAAASRVSGIPLRTIQNWMELSDFQLALEDAQNDIAQTYSKRMLMLQGKAIDTLEDLLDNPAQPEAPIKLRVASKIIEHATRFREIAKAEKNQNSSSTDRMVRDIHNEYRSEYPFALWDPADSEFTTNDSGLDIKNQQLWDSKGRNTEELVVFPKFENWYSSNCLNHDVHQKT